MVPKEVLYDLFCEKIKSVLKDTQYEDSILDDYIQAIDSWFEKYKQDQIDKSGFEMFLKHFVEVSGPFIKGTKGEQKEQTISVLESFLKEIEEHASDEVTKELEQAIGEIGGSGMSVAGDSHGWIGSILKHKTILGTIIALLVIGVVAMIYFAPEGDSGFANETELSDEVEAGDSLVNNSESLIDENSIVESLDNEEESSDPYPIDIEVEPTQAMNALTSLETQVIDLINIQRESYYVDTFEVDHEYTKLLKGNSNNIAEQLEIELFVYEVDEELSLKGDDIPFAIYTQMNKRNLFDGELAYIAIKIDEKAYKIYNVQLAYY